QAEAQLRHFLPLTEKVIAQAQARIFEGQTHYPDKILSLFEEHTVVIRKGKAHKPNEFGRLVRIDEVENGIVSNYHIALNNMADQQQWKPALEGHKQIFEQAPHLATADRGFWSAANEALAQELGVKRRSCRAVVAYPRKERLAKSSAGSVAGRAGGLALRRASARSSIALGCFALITKQRAALSVMLARVWWHKI